MSRPLLVLRPEPGASTTVAAAREMGLRAIAAPLFAVRPLKWAPPARLPDAVLLTSANAARHGGDGLARYTHLPLYAVGSATAIAAQRAGFARIIAGESDAKAIVARAEAEGVGRLLHLAGREHRDTAGCVPAIETRIVYASEALDTLPDGARKALPEAVALLHSPRAAGLFSRLVGIRHQIGIAVLSPAVAAAAGPGWRTVATAPCPTDTALLAAAAKLCDH